MMYFTKITLLMAAFSVTGCAYRYVDDSGQQHVIGLVAMEIGPPPAQAPAVAGDVTRITALGLSLSKTPLQTGIALGYSRDEFAVLDNNALVCGLPADVLAPESGNTRHPL